nr:PREDICTED: suppressor protein SRP40-like [Bemisia tabaci]
MQVLLIQLIRLISASIKAQRFRKLTESTYSVHKSHYFVVRNTVQVMSQSNPHGLSILRISLFSLIVHLVSPVTMAGDAEKTSMTCFHLRGGIIWCPKSLKGSIEQWAALIDDAADYGTHSKITTEFFQIEKAGLSAQRSSISYPKKGGNHLSTNPPSSQSSHPENSGPLICVTHKENSDISNFGADLPEPLDLGSNKDEEPQNQQLQVRDNRVQRQISSPRVSFSGPSPSSSSSSSSSSGSSSRSSSSSGSFSSPGSGSSSRSSGGYSVVKNTRRKRPLPGKKRQKSMTTHVRNLVSGIKKGSAWLLRKTPLQSLARTKKDTSALQSKNNVSRQVQPRERGDSSAGTAETSPDRSRSLSPSPQQPPGPRPSPQGQKPLKPRVTLTEAMKARIFRLAATLFPSFSHSTKDDPAEVTDKPEEDDDDAQSSMTDSTDLVDGARPYDWDLSASEHLKPHNNRVVKRKEEKRRNDDDTPTMPVTGWSRKPLNAQDLALRLAPLAQLQNAGYELRKPPRKYKYDYLEKGKG